MQSASILGLPSPSSICSPWSLAFEAGLGVEHAVPPLFKAHQLLQPVHSCIPSHAKPGADLRQGRPQLCVVQRPIPIQNIPVGQIGWSTLAVDDWDLDGTDPSLRGEGWLWKGTSLTR
uniref:Uncharacterized protein n=1 Tax=Oryza glumipatula TaxID=40148 RepID=A0A0E0B195_9ORYZ